MRKSCSFDPIPKTIVCFVNMGSDEDLSELCGDERMTVVGRSVSFVTIVISELDQTGGMGGYCDSCLLRHAAMECS